MFNKVFFTFFLVFIVCFFGISDLIYSEKVSVTKYYKSLTYDIDKKIYKFSNEITKDDLEDYTLYYKVYYIEIEIYQYDMYLYEKLYSTFVFEKNKVKKIINYSNGKVYVVAYLNENEELIKQASYNKLEELEEIAYYNKNGKKYKISVYHNDIEKETIYLDEKENKKNSILYYEGKKIYYHSNGEIKKIIRFRPRNYPLKN